MPKEQSARRGLLVASNETAGATLVIRRTGLPVESVLAWLNDQPGVAIASNLAGVVDAALVAFPGLERDDVLACIDVHQDRIRKASRRAARQGEGKERLAAKHEHALMEPDNGLNKLQIFRSLLAPLRVGALLDLGAGRGNFSLAAADLGWQVTAVDARTARFPVADDPNSAKANKIAAVHWVQADIREFPIAPGQFDVICILGLLHHLEIADQESLLKRCSASLTIVDTRIVPEGLDTVGEYEGAIQREHGETEEERADVAQASWGNATSFRHTEASLLRLAQNAGYAKLLRMVPPHRRNYTYFLCLPNPR